jgi:hypothetical protein
MAKSLQMSYQALQETSQLDITQPRFTFDEFNELVGLDEFD